MFEFTKELLKKAGLANIHSGIQELLLIDILTLYVSFMSIENMENIYIKKNENIYKNMAGDLYTTVELEVVARCLPLHEIPYIKYENLIKIIIEAIYDDIEKFNLV